MNAHSLVKTLVALTLVFGLAVAVHAQSGAPSPPPSQPAPYGQGQQGGGEKDTTPGAPDRGVQSQDKGPAPSPGVTVESRSESRTEGEQGRILGVNPTVAMVIGAALVAIIVIALVAMTKRSGSGHTESRRSV